MSSAGALVVHRSNRIEALVDALAELVAQPLPDPFAAEPIVVQGRGMGRWLAMELARRRGIWANPAFGFPRQLIEDATAAVLGDPERIIEPFDPDTVRWAIAELLPEQLERPLFAPVGRYLSGDPRGVKRSQLAGRLADLFDQYAVYRPYMVLQWENGADRDDWQAELWRLLVRRHGATHVAARAHSLRAALAAGRVPGDGFPRRVSLFGLSTLPPLYVEILAALAASVEIHLFLLSPSREYWGEIRARRETIRALTRRGAAAADDLHLAEGHPLLASLGRVGRDFQQVLEGCADYQDDPRERYQEPGLGSMLAALQSDILALRSRGSGPDREPRIELRRDDDSIAVHACHGPTRELEVLHDQLLALFDSGPTLDPQDVVVMTPSIDSYAPAIDAVFGCARPVIPFRIADRSTRRQHEVVDAFLRALELLRGRFQAPAVLDLVALEPVRLRFGIAAEEIDRLRSWVAEAAVRWGADDEHRAELGQPACADNTWRFGLDRLLLGYALPGDDSVLFEGVLSVDDVEGADAALLGRFAELCATLGRFRSGLRVPRHPAAWREALGALRDALLAATAANAFQHERIGRALEGLAQHASSGGFTGAIDLDAMRALLEAELERDISPRGFLTGAVTFCEMVPMRTVPFRVVCLIGLNDDGFPRARRVPGFDRMAAHPLAGDRTARDDDRYLFLEALLAAREHLIITYVGQSISDNTELAPSVVVSELLDALDQSFVEPSGARPRDRIVRRHLLQPFSPSYFLPTPATGVGGSDRELFSYDATHCAAARALLAPHAVPPAFLATPLADEPIDTVALDDLVRFFENPSRWFLQRRLGIFLGREAPILDAREPFELDALATWQIGDIVLRQLLRGGDVAAAKAARLASGALPLGTPGRCTLKAIMPVVEALAQAGTALAVGDRLAAEEVDLQLDSARLTGELRELWSSGQLYVQYSKLGRRQELALWIRHLVRNATHAPDAPSVLIGRPQRAGDAMQVWFRPVSAARRHLAELVELFRRGQREPLPLFQHASRAFSVTLRRPRATLEDAWNNAAKAFHSTRYGRGDDADDYVAILYRDRALLAGPPSADGPFASVAEQVFAPLLAHREERG